MVEKRNGALLAALAYFYNPLLRWLKIAAALNQGRKAH